MEYNTRRDYLNHLMEIRDLGAITDELKTMHAADIAEFFRDIDPPDRLLVFRLLSKEQSVDVYTYLSPAQRRHLLATGDEEEIRAILQELAFDDRIDALEEMPAGAITKMLAHAPARERELINAFLNYPEDCAGSLMTIEQVELKGEWTVKEALENIRNTAADKETIYTCYVLDDSRKLEGFVSLRELVIADEDRLVSEMMERGVISVEAHEDQEKVAAMFQKYGYLALPVVDKEDRLLGIITVDDIMDVMEDEATEDFHKMAAMEPVEGDYMETSAWALAKSRIPWLLILMISATFTGGIINHYQWIISDFIILTTFIPMITDTGGNTGSQASTVVIRGIATGEIALQDLFHVMIKEATVGVIAGVVLAVVNFLRLILIVKAGFLVSLLVSLTIVITVILSKLLGACLPILMKRIGVDPALVAGSLITTIIDSLVLVIYFNLAALLLYHL